MKTTMYFNYTSRSLQRGGQRTLLALFCVAVGVMAIVALQLVGSMINNALKYVRLHWVKVVSIHL